MSSRTQGPRRTERATFTALRSRTALSVVLTPVSPQRTSPSQAVMLLIRLIAETRSAEPKRYRSLTSFPSMNLKHGPSTAAPHESLHPFGLGQI
jgi:hypothetical protein